MATEYGHFYNVAKLINIQAQIQQYQVLYMVFTGIKEHALFYELEVLPSSICQNYTVSMVTNIACFNTFVNFDYIYR